MQRDRLLTADNPVQLRTTVAAPTAAPTGGAEDALGLSSSEGVIGCTVDAAAGANLTLRWHCQALGQWILAGASAADAARSCAQYAYVQWSVPPFVPIHISSDGAANLTIGGLK